MEDNVIITMEDVVKLNAISGVTHQGLQIDNLPVSARYPNGGLMVNGVPCDWRGRPYSTKS